MPSGYDQVCLNAAGGVATADPSGCSTAAALEGKYRQQVDSYAWTLSDAREAVLSGQNPGWGASRVPPYQVASDITNNASEYCKFYPGACPADAGKLASTYVDILKDLVAQFGFDMQGNYSASLDNQPQEGGLFPEGVTTTPVALTPNVANYSPSAGWRPPIDALPPTLSPTIPAYTSPSNVLSTSGPGAGGSVLASGGGTDLAGTASGSGASQGGSTTQQTTLNPSGNAAAAVASLAPGSQNTKLLVILLVIAVAVILFGRN